MVSNRILFFVLALALPATAQASTSAQSAGPGQPSAASGSNRQGSAGQEAKDASGPDRTPDTLDLQTALSLALSGNHELRLEDARVAAATAAEAEAQVGYRPQIFFDELVSRTTQPGMVFGQLLGQERFTAADFDVDFLNEPDPLTNFTSRLTVQQSLWAGGRTRSAAHFARSNRLAVALDRDHNRQEISHQVVEAYSGALLARNREDVARAAVDTALEHVRLASDLGAAGLVVSSDVLLAKVRVSEVDEMLVTARGESDVARAQLNLVMGRDQGTPLVLSSAPLSGPDAQVMEEDVDSLVAEAWERRRDLQAAGQRVEASDWEDRRARSGYRPQVGLLGSLEANDEDLFGVGGTNWTVMASLRWSLYDGGATRARLRVARELGVQARVQEDLLREQIALQVRLAVSRLAAARQKKTLSQGAVEMAGESLRILADRYAEGLVPLVELLEAEDALTRARFREAAARREMFVADSLVRLAVGGWSEGGRS